MVIEPVIPRDIGTWVLPHQASEPSEEQNRKISHVGLMQYRESPVTSMIGSWSEIIGNIPARMTSTEASPAHQRNRDFWLCVWPNETAAENTENWQQPQNKAVHPPRLRCVRFTRGRKRIFHRNGMACADASH
jgi:hypothetical protein